MASVNQVRDQSQPKSQSNLMINLARDLTSVVSLGILLFCIHEFASPFIRGFQCDDETIRYPYKESTVSSGVCYFVGSGINILLILVVEYLNLVSSHATPANDSASARETGISGFHVKVYLQNVYCKILVWLFGAITSELITDITKVTAGRLRPHFIDICRPVVIDNGIEKNLTSYCFQKHDPYEYITHYRCSGAPAKQRDARLSFLSGHSSYSAYSATFAIFYIQSAVDITKLGLLKPAFQVLIISAAFYTGLTRVSDYKHHWQDVLAGLILGTSVATTVSIHLLPSLYKTYSKFLKSSNQRPGADQGGEELNRFSY